jgi:phage terminase large subunit-like protein
LPKADAVKQGLKFYFDEDKAAHAVQFFEQFLTHSKGQFAGKPFSLLSWQKHDIIEELFGWMRVDTDTRKFRVGYIEVPKKNGVLAPAAGCRGGQDDPQESQLSSAA